MFSKSTGKVIAASVKAKSSGFTLIEVMVGVAIFAVLSAMVVSSIQSNGDRNAKLEAQRFVAVVNEIRDEAVISGKTFIMDMNEKGGEYGFTIQGGQEQETTDSLIRSRKLHKSVKLKWEVYEEFNDDDSDEEEEGAGENEPRVYVTALGELTPFSARFGGENDDFVVTLNDEGVLVIDIKASNFF